VTDVRRALDTDELIGRMYADPDLRGDLLAVGLAIARLKREGQRRALTDIAEMIGWRNGGRPNWLRVKYVLANDRPRYLPSADRPSACAAPMIRREGPCGRPTSSGVMLRDATTGEMERLPACSRHRDWAETLRRQTWALWRDAGSPEPPANTGGVLARHIDLDWPTIYRWGDKEWAMPSSGPPAPSTPRPRFTIVTGDGEGGEVERDLAPVPGR
jgi:hypothetical protein